MLLETKPVVLVALVTLLCYSKSAQAERIYAPEAHHLMLVLDPTDPEAYYEQGRFYEATKHYANAISAYTRAIAIWPTAIKYLEARVRIYKRIEAYESARQDLTRIIKLNPRHKRIDVVHDDLAWALLELGRANEAIVHARKAIELSPHNGDFAYTCARILKALERNREAKAQFERVLQLGSAHPEDLEDAEDELDIRE
jgi:tetratricopeptide (TPR) repeat protein